MLIAVVTAAAVVLALVWLWLMRRARRAKVAAIDAPSVSTDGSDAAAPRWTDVADRLTLGVVIAGPSGRVHYRNPAAGAFAGSHAGLLVDDAVEKVLAGALDGREERQNVDLYGPPRVAVFVAASPLPGGGAMVTIEDVSERRRVDAVRTDFVANISHELKTPVGALAVLAETLSDASDDDLGPGMVRHIAGRMVEESHRVGRTIDDLMELSRIELGEEPVRDLVAVDDVV
jgi:two-component system sensor histidine kinase SenX3